MMKEKTMARLRLKQVCRRRFDMKWIEIITLRSLVKENRQLIDELLRQVCQQKKSELAASITVYHNPAVETDLSIHIHWETEAQQPRKSPLGNQLYYALKELGLISYSIWLEVAAVEEPLVKATMQLQAR
jgi:hypothetical protein